MLVAVKPRLAIIITHPSRYIIPLVQLLVRRNKIDVKVFFTYGPELLKLRGYSKEYRNKYEPAVSLYENYDFEFVENIAKKKTIKNFSGINNPVLIERIKEWNPDDILVSGWKFHSHLKVMKYFKGKIPVHFRGDSTLLDEPSLGFFRKMARRLWLTYVYKHIDKAWYVGNNNKDYFLKMKVPAEKLIYIPHVIDNDRFKRTPELAARALAEKQSLNIQHDAPVFLYAGRMIKAKGVLMLLEAFKLANLNNTHLLFVGAGPCLNEMRQMASGSHNIHFITHQPQTNMPLIYSMCDVLILPSETDSWGLVLNEAMANGLAVIATNKCGGAIDLIKEGENGYIFNSGDSAALTSIMKNIVHDSLRLKQMKDNSLKRIKDFSYDIAAEKIETIVLKIH